VRGYKDQVATHTVIPANAGIQRRLNKDTGFRVPLCGPGTTASGPFPDPLPFLSPYHGDWLFLQP